MTRLAVAALCALFAVSPAFGQRPAPAPDSLAPDTPRRPPAPVVPALEGLQIARPAALLFASFDQDGDLFVSDAELADGIAGAFASLDVSGSGQIGLLTYADWSARALGAREAVPGRVAVDPDLDGGVTAAEFTTAFIAQAETYRDEEAGGIPFSALTRAFDPALLRRARGAGRDGPRAD